MHNELRNTVVDDELNDDSDYDYDYDDDVNMNELLIASSLLHQQRM
jgi:hypothetical protein